MLNEQTPLYMTEAMNAHLDRVSSNFILDESPLLEELILNNLSYPNFSKDFDTDLLGRYEKHSTLLKALNTLDTPSIGQLVKIQCSNGRNHEQALITCQTADTVTLCINGGGFLHSDSLKSTGVSMSVCGGYFKDVPISALRVLDEHTKTFTFSGTGRVEADCGITINRSIKRWLLDDKHDALGFY